jgi:hypothetical protein
MTILEAADVLGTAMHVGIPNLPIVAKLREQQGLTVNDGPARSLAIGEIWTAVDGGVLRPVAVEPRRVVTLSMANS